MRTAVQFVAEVRELCCCLEFPGVSLFRSSVPFLCAIDRAVDGLDAYFASFYCTYLDFMLSFAPVFMRTCVLSVAEVRHLRP
jgi:hypothetical protein